VSGYDVLRALAVKCAEPTPSVIVMSNDPEPRDEDERRLLADGALCVFGKAELHADPRRLVTLIRSHLARRQADANANPQRRAA
jgi:hypothetical protein